MLRRLTAIATALAITASTIVVALVGIVATAHRSAASTGTLVQAGTTQAVAENQSVATSPSGTWTALAVTVSGTASVLRSPDGLNWQNVGSPTSSQVSVAISDSGEVYAVASAGGSYPATNFWRYTTAWSGPVTYETRNGCLYCGPLAVLTDGTTLVGITSRDGATWMSTDDGNTWTEAASGIGPTGNYLAIIGSYVQAVGPGYARWSIPNRAPAPPTTPPAFDSSMGPAGMFSTNGSTTDLWIVGRGGFSSGTNSYGGFYLYHSTDAGSTWSTVTRAEMMPASFPSSNATFSMGSDNRIHAYGQSYSNGSMTIYEDNRGLGTTQDWSGVSTLVSEPSSGPAGAGPAATTQQVNGGQPGVINEWFSLPDPASGYDDYLVTGTGQLISVPPPTSTKMTGSLVQAGTTQPVPPTIATSPHGTWTAVVVNVNGVQSVLRSTDGLVWQNLGSPTSNQALVAISDSGEVYLVASGGGYYPTTGFWRYTNGWYGPAIYETRNTYLFAGPLAILTDGTTLIGITSQSGDMWTSTDDGDTWTQNGSVSLPSGPVSEQVIGSYVQILGSSAVYQGWTDGYVRWSIPSRAPAPPTTPPAFDSHAQATALFSTNGSTTDLWIAANGTYTSNAFYLYHSTDGGSTWSTVATTESYPAGLGPMGWFSMGSDNRVRAYGESFANGTERIFEANRGLGATPDWSAVSTLLAVPSSGNGVGTGLGAGTTQLASGGQPALTSEWFSVGDPAGGTNLVYDDYWVLRGGPPQGGLITAGEQLGGAHNASEACLPCSVPNVSHFPITPSTGNFWHTFDDLEIPGRGVPISFTHTYNSLAAATNGPLGYGWTNSYAMSLAVGSGNTTVTVNQEDGSQVSFSLSGSAYVSPPRVMATLVHNPDGRWTFTRRAKQIFTFNAAGQLTQEKDLNGYVTSLAYNGSGQLATVVARHVD